MLGGPDESDGMGEPGKPGLEPSGKRIYRPLLVWYKTSQALVLTKGRERSALTGDLHPSRRYTEKKLCGNFQPAALVFEE